MVDWQEKVPVHFSKLPFLLINNWKNSLYVESLNNNIIDIHVKPLEIIYTYDWNKNELYCPPWPLNTSILQLRLQFGQPSSENSSPIRITQPSLCGTENQIIQELNFYVIQIPDYFAFKRNFKEHSALSNFPMQSMIKLIVTR